MVAIIGGGLTFFMHKARNGVALSTVQLFKNHPGNYPNLLAFSENELHGTDIAEMNLLCATGLPGAENLNMSECLATLDAWAQRVKYGTEKNLYRFRDHPKEYENSEGYFRMLMMAVVLCEDLGVRYNPEKISSPDAVNPTAGFFRDSQDVFLHGLLSKNKMGTCSSMPVLYAALARRLEYPVKLVTTRAHLFLRWEDTRERFNMDATGQGMNRYNDDHYRNWPFPLSEEEIRAEGYLKSLTTSEELAVFLSIRGGVLVEAGRLQEAVQVFGEVARRTPNWRSSQVMLAEVEQMVAMRQQAQRVQVECILRQQEMQRMTYDPILNPNPRLKLQKTTYNAEP
jgi:hypothetical protein